MTPSTQRTPSKTKKKKAAPKPTQRSWVDYEAGKARGRWSAAVAARRSSEGRNAGCP